MTMHGNAVRLSFDVMTDGGIQTFVTDAGMDVVEWNKIDADAREEVAEYVFQGLAEAPLEWVWWDWEVV